MQASKTRLFNGASLMRKPEMWSPVLRARRPNLPDVEQRSTMDFIREYEATPLPDLNNHKLVAEFERMASLARFTSMEMRHVVSCFFRLKASLETPALQSIDAWRLMHVINDHARQYVKERGQEVLQRRGHQRFMYWFEKYGEHYRCSVFK